MSLNELPTFEVGERLRGFPGKRMQQIVDAIQDVDGIPSASLDEGIGPVTQRALVLSVANQHSAEIERFHILGFKDLVDPPNDAAADGGEQDAQAEFLVNGELPDTSSHGTNILIAQEPIGTLVDNGAGNCMIIGVSRVKVDIKNESDTTAGLITGDATKLESGKAGATILYKPAGTGVKWCLVLLGGGEKQYTQIGGLVDADVDVGDPTFLIKNVTPLADSRMPALDGNDKLRVAQGPTAHCYAADDSVICLYYPNATTYDPTPGSPSSGDEQDIDWVTIDTQFKNILIKASATMDVSAGAAVVVVDQVTAVASGVCPVDSPSDLITARRSDKGADLLTGDDVICFWNQSTGEWEEIASGGTGSSSGGTKFVVIDYEGTAPTPQPGSQSSRTIEPNEGCLYTGRLIQPEVSGDVCDNGRWDLTDLNSLPKVWVSLNDNNPLRYGGVAPLMPIYSIHRGDLVGTQNWKADPGDPDDIRPLYFVDPPTAEKEFADLALLWLPPSTSVAVPRTETDFDEAAHGATAGLTDGDPAHRAGISTVRVANIGRNGFMVPTAQTVTVLNTSLNGVLVPTGYGDLREEGIFFWGKLIYQPTDEETDDPIYAAVGTAQPQQIGSYNHSYQQVLGKNADFNPFWSGNNDGSDPEDTSPLSPFAGTTQTFVSGVQCANGSIVVTTDQVQGL